MKTIIFTTSTSPESDAGAVRVTTMAKALNLLGHDVLIVLMNNFNNYKVYNFDGINYVSLKKRFRNYKSSVKEMLLFLNISWDNFIIYSTTIPAFLYLKSYALKNSINLYYDCVEWYSMSQFGPFSYAYYEKDIINRIIIDNNFKVIAISKYLENYYRNKGISVIRVPVLLDVQNIGFNKITPSDKIVIVYAGSPAKKDKLQIAIKGLLLLSNTELEKIEFNIIGINTEEFNKNIHVNYMRANNSIKILGKIPRKNVLTHLSRAHFTILFRNAKKRYAKAGFPTKFVESLSTATPVILNISSDLSDYIINRENGFVINDYSPESICEVFRFILSLPNSELKIMQEKARKTAELHFEYRNYVKNLYDFIKK